MKRLLNLLRCDIQIARNFKSTRLCCSKLIALLTITSPIVINVPTRSLLAVEKKHSFLLWLAKFKYETFELYVFNFRSQKEDKSINHYVSGLKTQTKSCNFCQCLKNSLLRDTTVFGVKERALRKRLLRERQFTLKKQSTSA